MKVYFNTASVTPYTFKGIQNIVCKNSGSILPADTFTRTAKLQSLKENEGFGFCNSLGMTEHLKTKQQKGLNDRVNMRLAEILGEDELIEDADMFLERMTY